MAFRIEECQWKKLLLLSKEEWKEALTKKGLAQSPFLLFAGREFSVIVFSLSRFYFKNFNFIMSVLPPSNPFLVSLD